MCVCVRASIICSIDDRPRDVVTPQMSVFLHFHRLEIPITEIRSSFVGTREFWQRQRRLCISNVSFLSFPLLLTEHPEGDTYNSSWWCHPSTPYTIRIDASAQSINVCHRRQTYSVINRKVYFTLCQHSLALPRASHSRIARDPTIRNALHRSKRPK
jgi:hypothetical protein